jgi:hypothetical protein
MGCSSQVKSSNVSSMGYCILDIADDLCGRQTTRGRKKEEKNKARKQQKGLTPDRGRTTD